MIEEFKYVVDNSKYVHINTDKIDTFINDLGDKYEEFLRKLYADENMTDYRMSKKLEYMDFAENNRIVAFLMDIGKADYIYNERKGKSTCTQIEEYKKKIRERYSKKLPKYYFDTVLHMTDDEIELDYSIRILEKYKDYCLDSFLRNGYDPIIKWNTNENEETKRYIKIFEKLR